MVRRIWMVAAAALAVAPATAEAARKANLKVTAVAATPQGTAVKITARVRNAGGRSARPTRTVVFLSRDGRRSVDDVRLATLRVPALRPRATRRRAAAVPAPAPGTYRLIACADASRKVKESRERDNCRTARQPLAIPAAGSAAPPSPLPPLATPGADGDRDGTPDAADCAPTDPTIHPGATDEPDAGVRDSDCDGIDGTAEKAIFVSPIGDDAAPGTRAAPKRTLAAATQAAVEADRDVYATLGTYEETLFVADGVSVYGGYHPSWARDAAATTRITGGSSTPWVAAIASMVHTPTVLQQLTLAPKAGTPGSGLSTYGLAAIESAGLRLERLTVVGAPGGSGAAGQARPQPPKAARGGDGRNGHNDYNGSNAGDGGAGGESSYNRPGGRGGWGAEGEDGGDGVAGSVQGLGGGPPGVGGAAGDPGKPGGKGGNGDPGTNGVDGAGGRGGRETPLWFSDAGADGGSGTHGHGGGGGGAGGGETCTSCNDGVGNGGGGGGAGGAAGIGGRGGTGGGGSFGLYLVESTGLSIADCVVTAADGGKGGAGGDRGLGGQGGDGGLGATAFSPGDIGAGGNGGAGGHGGFGGYGGGGAGGPSWAIYRGATVVEPRNTSLAFGAPGAGGYSPSGNSGTAGAAGAIN